MNEDPPSEESTCADGQVPQSQAEEPAAADVTDSEEEKFELPEALRSLIHISGVKFKAVPENTWNIDGCAAKLKRKFSVTFSADIEISSADILDTLLKTEVDPDNIVAIQFRGSNRSWVVSFTTDIRQRSNGANAFIQNHSVER